MILIVLAVKFEQFDIQRSHTLSSVFLTNMQKPKISFVIYLVVTIRSFSQLHAHWFEHFTGTQHPRPQSMQNANALSLGVQLCSISYKLQHLFKQWGPAKNKTKHDMTWHDMTWHDMTWHDMTWHDMTRQDKAKQNKTHMTRQDKTRQDKTRQDKAK